MRELSSSSRSLPGLTHLSVGLLSLLPLLLLSGVASGQLAEQAELRAAELRFFEQEVRPLLAEHCWSCHGSSKQQAGLRLDNHAGLLRGGESGAVVVAGDVDASSLITAIRYEDLEMPPAEQLDPRSIRVLEKWVSIGAPWPAHDALPPRDEQSKISAEDRQWWAFQPLSEPEIPTIAAAGTTTPAGWDESPIDAFLLTAMREQGLQPTPAADRATLARRLFLNLVGVPPSPAEMRQFLDDQDPNAYANLVDRLLDDPRYGERWAQHWLDLVRYADSDGYRADFYRPHAWRYRDYVIDSLNQDKPYDRFVQEQLAGDELFPDSPTAKIATGYLRNWIYEYNLRDARGQWNTILSDVTDTTGDVFLGMGMQCAKCHDHKFDPILQRDYFRLRAFFEPLLPVSEFAATGEALQQYKADLAKWEAATAEIREQIAALEQPHRERLSEVAIARFPLDIQAMLRTDPSQREPHEHQLAELAYRQVDYDLEQLDKQFKDDSKQRRDALLAELAKFDSLKPTPPPTAMVAVDVGPEAPVTTIPGIPAEPIAPGFLTILEPEPAEIPDITGQPTTGRRAALARWLTRPDNPLSTRVIVNRVWQYHFGRGLAPNASDFGRLAGEPTHPQLLDWLTVQFVRDGWSLKKLHRRILLSAAYRQATSGDDRAKFAAQTEMDPANDYYWRGDTRRLDAEQIRDTILAVSGELDWQRGGPGYAGDKPRRSIYRRIMRNSRDPFLDVFDLPLFFNSEASRNTTTTPLQSLLLINSPKMLGHARRFADRIWNSGADRPARINQLWELAVGRGVTPDELRMAEAYLDQVYQLAVEEQREQRQQQTQISTAELAADLGDALEISPQRDKLAAQVPLATDWPRHDFTIEAYFRVRSVYDSGAVRTIASQRHGNGPGWSFGVTGKGSRRKPQTLVIQLWGPQQTGGFGETALFSGDDLKLNHDYYAAVSVRWAEQPSGTSAANASAVSASDGKPSAGNANPGSVTFYLRDLSEPAGHLHAVMLPHTAVGQIESQANLVIGGRDTSNVNLFDGLIDDVRISSQVLPPDQLLVAVSEDRSRAVVGGDGFWRFNAEPHWAHDHSGNDRHLLPPGQLLQLPDPERIALVDLCHALLNSNEFLYVD
ncbi:DUF1549 domain-containing protein [Planctomycetaceae bacterium SH139]